MGLGQMLFTSAQRDDATSLSNLICQGAPVNYCNSMGQTLLHIASMWGSVSVAKLLIDTNADVNAKNTSESYSGTPLHVVAIGNGEPTKRALVAKLLVEGGADVTLKNDNGQLAWQLVS